MKNRLTTALIGAGVLGLVLVGCGATGASANRTNEDSFFEIHKHLEDGRTVTCLGQASGSGYAISCDWAGAK